MRSFHDALCWTFAVIMTVLLAVATSAAETAFHVSPKGDDTAAGDRLHPFATLTRARDAVRALKAKGALKSPVTVSLADGVHILTEPLILTPEDSGTVEAPITYTAAPGASPVISGGRRITGWTKGDNALWSAPVPELNGQPWTFRQIYVNSAWRPRARTPNEGFYLVAGTPDGGPEAPQNTASRRFQFEEGHLKAGWKNPRDIEVIVYTFWNEAHLLVDSIDADTRTVTFQTFSRKRFTDSHTSGRARYVVDNVFEALDLPGEWYLDRPAARLYYLPRPGEDPNQLEITAPVAPAMVVATGNPLEQRFVEHVAFTNLTFEYTRFQLPPDDPGDRKQGAITVPGAFQFTGVRHLTFEHNRLRNLGTAGLVIGKGSSHLRIAANEISGLAAGALRVDGGTENQHPLERTGNLQILDNHIHDYGLTYPAAVGVLLMHSAGNTIAHNHIHDGYYTGISAGWVWGYSRSISRDNLIEFNHIHDIGKGLLSDMGGIYTLGVSPGTLIRNNHIHHVDAHLYGGWGIYQDEGSTSVLVENNLVHDTKYAAYMVHYARDVTVRNNIFAFGRLEQLRRGQPEPHKTFYIENNIVYWTEGTLFARRWQDITYTYHVKGKNAPGDDQEFSSTYDIDYNLYFNPATPLEQITFFEGSFEEWKKKGKDVHSLFADPQFVDPDKRDFRLKPTSPALALGFKPFDLSTVGPRTRVGPVTTAD